MKQIISYSFIAVGVGTLVTLSFLSGLFSGLELFLEDRLFAERPLDPRLIIIAIDDESIQRIGQWPWPRAVFAEALERLNMYHPAAVGIDVLFAEPSRLGDADDDRMALTLETISYPLILPFEQKEGGMLRPLSRFENAGSVSVGHVNLMLDRDGVARHMPTLTEGRPFAYELITRSGETIDPFYETRDAVRIVYAAPPGAIRRIPFWRLFDEGLSIQDDNVILIGATAPDLHDTKPTPFSRGEEMPGIEIQAHIANMILSGFMLNPLTSAKIIFWIFGAAFIPLLIGFFTQKRLLPFLISNAVFGVLSLIAAFVLFDRGIAANILHPQFAWIFSTAAIGSYRYLIGERKRREMRAIFSKYVSTHVLEEILRDPKHIALGGEEKEITVLFSDIRGFTTISEILTPPDLVALLNRYFSFMSEEIMRTGGIIDKYIGDAIMAFWGAPLPDEHQADHALESAAGMLERLNTFNDELRREDKPEIRIGIGIYTGKAVVGNVGSAQRFDYTVMGDTVNVASRLEGLTKEYNVPLIIGETTKAKSSRVKSSFSPLGSATVKGKTKPVLIYTLASSRTTSP